MKIQFCSDLHLEFPLNEKLVKKYPLEKAGDILILAGDIVPFKLIDQHSDFFDYVSQKFEFTYWVPGNHEYYHDDLSLRSGNVEEKIRENVFLLNNTSRVHGHIELIFSTLWSLINPNNEWQIQQALSDFHVITNAGNRFTVADFNELHKNSLLFLEERLNQSPQTTKVVVTHHVPTFQHYPPQFKGSPLSEAFATELTPFIETSNVHSWIYGHHHCNIPDFKIGNTNMLTNQLGYVKYGENRNFSNSKTIEL